MSIDIRLPNITAPTESGQLSQMRSYLYQFAEQLQWALNTLENNQTSDAVVLRDAVGNIVEQTEEAKAQDTFNSIKSLIIKSADIVDAYYEEIDNLLSLSGKYVAESEFGSFKEETNHTISATSDYVESKFTKTETIDGEVVESEYSLEDIDSRIRHQEGVIRAGNIQVYIDEDGTLRKESQEVTGIEIRDNKTVDGETQKRFATFSARGIELYGDSRAVKPVAYISGATLSITSAEFTSYVKMGKYRLDLSNGIAFKWEGG